MDLIDVQEVVRPRTEGDIPRWEAGDRYVAGGTWLFSEPQPGVRRLIDLTEIAWPKLARRDSDLRIAANCTYEELEQAPQLLGSTAPLFARAIRTLSSSFKTYGLATVGGNLCLAYAKSMMAPVFCALDARYELARPGGATRTVDAVDFQLGVCETILQPGEYLRAVIVPAAALAGRYSVRKHSYTPTSHATAMVIAAVVDGDAGTVPAELAERNAALVVSAATTYPVRVAIDPDADEAEISRAIDEVCAGHWLLDDAHGSPEYRVAVLHHLAREAWREVGGAGGSA